ncbi:hypothetical protein [Paenibacillus phytorum]|uniref:hypothetical protein n=1 Tax=Paenibacillus phytorum TaxID=2654977 RepID=UPI00149278B5|nr:hypothetical protein [Paenibacillus phytorum]
MAKKGQIFEHYTKAQLQIGCQHPLQPIELTCRIVQQVNTEKGLFIIKRIILLLK